MAPALLLVSDWDETITCRDTLRLIAPHNSEIQNNTLPFQHYEDEYYKDQVAFKAQYGPVDSEAKLLDFVAKVAEAEQNTLNKVIEGGLFKNTKQADRRSRAHHVEFREGWSQVADFVRQHVQQDHMRMHVISVNWSRRFICDALVVRDGKEPCSCLQSDLRAICVADIHANEIEQHMGQDTCTGRIVGPLPDEKPMLTGMDKRFILDAIKAKYSPAPLTLYVGDGLHDLPCLLDADVGILMGDSPSLLDKLAKVGFSSNVRSLSEWQEAFRDSRPQCPSGLVHVQSWHEVLELIETLAGALDGLQCLHQRDV